MNHIPGKYNPNDDVLPDIYYNEAIEEYNKTLAMAYTSCGMLDLLYRAFIHSFEQKINNIENFNEYKFKNYLDYVSKISQYLFPYLILYDKNDKLTIQDGNSYELKARFVISIDNVETIFNNYDNIPQKTDNKIDITNYKDIIDTLYPDDNAPYFLDKLDSIKKYSIEQIDKIIKNEPYEEEKEKERIKSDDLIIEGTTEDITVQTFEAVSSKEVNVTKLTKAIGNNSNKIIQNIFMEILRWLCLMIHVSTFTLCLIYPFINKDIKLITLGGIVLFYLFYLTYVQRGIEERYTLPLLAVALILSAYVLKNSFKKIISK
jgi:hypothetical protein